MTPPTPSCLLSLWNGPNLLGSFYQKALAKRTQLWTAGPELGFHSDFPREVRDPILPVIEKLGAAVEVYIQFYSKPDYFPPDLYEVSLPKVWVLYDLHLHWEPLCHACQLFDLIVVSDEPTRQQLIQAGIHNVIAIPFVVDQDTFYRHPNSRPRKYACGFSGSVQGHPQLKERRELLKHVAKHFDLKIEDRTLTGSQVADFYQDCSIVINHAVNNDLNMRIMEVLMAGRPLVTPRVDGIEKILQEGIHALIYDSPDDLLKKIHELLTHPERAEAMAKAGQQHALSHYSYDVAADQLLNATAKLVEEFKAGRCPQPSKGTKLAAQFRYHWFRYPGDALQWLTRQNSTQFLALKISPLAPQKPHFFAQMLGATTTRPLFPNQGLRMTVVATPVGPSIQNALRPSRISRKSSF